MGSEGWSMSQWGGGHPGSLQGGDVLAVLWKALLADLGTFKVPHILNDHDQMEEGLLASFGASWIVH